MEAVEKSVKGNALNIEKIRKDFPMLQTKHKGKVLVYLDSAATGQKPARVIEKLKNFYSTEYAKPKEEHELSKKVTKELEETRKKTADFIGAGSPQEIIFTRGCTESINIVATGFARGILEKGDEILITQLEHHANIIPWQMACETTGAKLVVAPIRKNGELDLEAFAKLINTKTKLISVLHSSHVMGTILPIREITRLAHKKDIPVLVDGAQSAPHMPVNMRELDCDFYTFSGHKMGTPSGVGVLYGRKQWLDKLPPGQGGGDMASKVTFEKSEYADLPEKFEAGTAPFAEIISFGALIDYLNELDMEKTSAYEKELMHYAEEKLSLIDGLTIMGSAEEREPVLSFAIDGVKMKKLEKEMSDEYNIMIRSGDLTAQPLLEVLGVKELARISFCYYNTKGEVDYFVAALRNFLKK
ncbi:MAG TPA: SufS family cysteine desulfurase [Flavisolibacter sp.]|nr:SufS family cysteine desulfurase [Flavisolibacter sp.]